MTTSRLPTGSGIELGKVHYRTGDDIAPSGVGPNGTSVAICASPTPTTV